MNTKLNASLLTVVAIASFATIASSPVSAKGHFGGNPRPVNYGNPLHGPGSPHNPRSPQLHQSPFYKDIGKNTGALLKLLNNPKTGEPKHGGPMHGGPGRGWGGRFYGPGFGYVAGYSAGTDYGAIVCGKHLHWSPRFNRCIPNYL